MTDIVERLTDAEKLFIKAGVDGENGAKLVADARDEIERLRSAIKRQAGAAKTLREHTLSEVRHLQEKDRSEYVAAKTLDSEREANALLTAEIERLRAALRVMVYETTHLSPEEDDGSHWCKISKSALSTARAALTQGGE